MLKKINTALRLLVVGLLIYPMPIAVAYHVDTQAPYGTNATAMTATGELVIGILGSDGAEDLPPDSYTIFFSTSSGVTETNSFCVTTSFGHQTNTWQYHTFSLDDLKYYFSNLASTLIYFRVRANNEANYNFSTLTNQSNIMMGSSGSLWDYSQTDWSAPTGTDACDDPKVLDGTPTPTNLTTSANLHNGSITVDWDISSATYQYPPERYAIGFDKADPPMYAVATGNVGDANGLNTEYTFTKSYLQSVLDPQVGDTLYFKIRSDNDTNSSYSSWTTVASYTIPDAASGPSEFSIQNTSYEGLQFSWTATDTGWASLDYYRIEYKLSSEETYTGIDISDTTATSYTIEDISAGTYDFNLYACTDSGFCHGSQAGPANNYVVNANTATTTTTVVYTLGPPMNPEVSNVYDSGVRVKWDVPNTGNATADTYELYYRTSPTDEVVIYNISNTEYTIPYANIPNGTYEFSIRAFDSVNNVYSGYSTEPTLTVFNQKAKDDADAAAAEAARKAEEERIAKEKAEAEAELQRQRDKNLSETGYSETDAERSAREQKEYEEEQARLKAIEEEKNANYNETGYYETDQERSDREQKEYEEEQARLAELERQRVKNEAETGYYETDAERSERERLEIEEAAEKAILAATSSPDDGNKVLTEEEEKELEELVDAIIDIKNNTDFEEYDVEEEVFEIKPIVITTTTTTTTTTTIPIKEDFPDEEEVEVIETDPLPSDEGDEEVQLTDEEVEELVTETEEAVKEIVVVEVVEEVLEEDATEEEIEAAQEEFEAAVEEVVKELPKEKKVEVVKEVAKVKVQNLATADNTTKAVVKAVVKEVTKVETVAELDEEEKEAVGEVLGFSEETAAEDVEKIAESAAKEENIAIAVEEYVERAIENADVENFTLADVVTEVQVEAFISDPVGAIIDVDLESIDFATIGQDMTQDQRQKSKEVVVPVIIASQIVAQAGALITRRPF
jgi:hypothetical protein